MVTNNVTVYQFEVGLDEVFTDEVRFRVNVFWASRPLEPAEWLALLILKAGDVESNPGPQNRSQVISHITT